MKLILSGEKILEFSSIECLRAFLVKNVPVGRVEIAVAKGVDKKGAGINCLWLGGTHFIHSFEFMWHKKPGRSCRLYPVFVNSRTFLAVSGKKV